MPRSQLDARPTPTRRSAAARRSADRPVVQYAVRQVPVTLLLTRHNDEKRPDRAEAAQFLALLDRLLIEFAPDVLIACQRAPDDLRGHARRAPPRHHHGVCRSRFRLLRIAYFADVNHVFTCSRYLTDVYRDKIGLVSTPLEPPLDWSTVVAPVDSRAFVTFVNPAPHKGLFLFARLADMLGSRRPDIPVLVVQSGQSGGSLNNIPGHRFQPLPADDGGAARADAAPSTSP